ncbi:MAG: septum formation initiator family protein [Candidatus Marinimicrobia bacterium]|nr:septum formation initiator family protein [Candidatus Neomarinimicrobiota bacterium]
MKKRRTAKKSLRKKFLADTRHKFFRGIILFGVSFLTIVFLFGDHGLYQLYKIKSQRKVTQKRIEELKTEIALLENEKKRLQTDLDYIERLAREKYRMAKKGEKVFKVIQRESKK